MTAHSEDRESLFSLITDWLDGYRDSDGGYAKITREDVTELYHIVDRLVKLKCQADPDGDRPIDFRLTNLNQCWPNRFRDVPYDHKSPDNEVLQTLLNNTAMAGSQLGDFLRTTLSVNKLLKESE